MTLLSATAAVTLVGFLNLIVILMGKRQALPRGHMTHPPGAER